MWSDSAMQTDQNSTKELGAWQRKGMCHMWLWKVLVGKQPGVYEMDKELSVIGEHNHQEMNGSVSSYSWKMERSVGERLAGGSGESRAVPCSALDVSREIKSILYQ